VTARDHGDAALGPSELCFSDENMNELSMLVKIRLRVDVAVLH
jgi:hypothetical protein